MGVQDLQQRPEIDATVTGTVNTPFKTESRKLQSCSRASFATAGRTSLQ